MSISSLIMSRLSVSVFFALVVFVALASGQTRGWLWQNPLPQGNAINAVRFAADKRHGWAVGSNGTILRTEDGGFSWEAQPGPSRRR
jgi:photosystem II stability/assembly factor-like uncharacterized protein